MIPAAAVATARLQDEPSCPAKAAFDPDRRPLSNDPCRKSAELC